MKKISSEKFNRKKIEKKFGKNLEKKFWKNKFAIKKK